MPAERINVSFEPRPLELLYSKYGPGKTTSSSSSSTPFTQPHPSSLIKAKGAGRKLGRAGDLPPRVPRPQELGDLKKLGRELSKMERVQMFLDMSNNVWKGKGQGQGHSHSQPSSSTVHVHCLQASCSQCTKDHKPAERQAATRLKNLKSQLRLVAARAAPEERRPELPEAGTSPLRHSSQNVVPLPLLQLNYTRNASSSEDFSALRDARKSLRHMLHPQPSISRRAAAAAVWNYRFSHGGPGGQQHARTKEFLKEYLGDMLGSSDSSSHVMPSAAAPACSPADELYDTKSASTFDADRVDSEQFEYVFDQLSNASSTGSWDSELSAQSDTATFSARAQRPSTTDTVATPQRNVETRASVAPPLSPLSPRQRTRDGESWPPQYTVVPSWPSLDDPFRFQYFGCGVHRDIMRRLHKSRGRRRNGKHGRGGSDSEQQEQLLQQPQKLKVVVPTYTECSVCNSQDCEHLTPRTTHTTGLPSGAPSVVAKSAKSRSSLSMSVCTVLSRQTKPLQYSGALPVSGKTTGRALPPEDSRSASPDSRANRCRLENGLDRKPVPVDRDTAVSKFGSGMASIDRRLYKASIH